MYRRRFLAGLGGVGLPVICGCVAVPGEDDSDGSVPPSTVTTSSVSSDAIARWMVAADEGSSPIGYEARSFSPARDAAVSDPLPGSQPTDASEPESYRWGSVDPSAVALEITVMPGDASDVSPYTIAKGSFDTDAARETLDAESPSGATTYEGFDVYDDVTPAQPGGTRSAFAVGDGAVLRAGALPGRRGTRADVERILDARVGASPRLVEEYQPIDRVAERIDLGLFTQFGVEDPSESVYGPAHPVTGVVARGVDRSYQDGDVVSRGVYVHQTADVVDAAQIEEYMRERLAVEDESPEIQVDGRTVVATLRTPAESS